MAHPRMYDDSSGPIKRLREICLRIPGVTEKEAWGECTFRVGSKMFAMTDNDHHKSGHIAVWVKAPLGYQSMMVGLAPKRFFLPPYVGHKGWVGVRLDVKVDWDEVASVIAEGCRMTQSEFPSRSRAGANGVPVTTTARRKKPRASRFPVGPAPRP